MDTFRLSQRRDRTNPSKSHKGKLFISDELVMKNRLKWKEDPRVFFQDDSFSADFREDAPVVLLCSTLRSADAEPLNELRRRIHAITYARLIEAFGRQCKKWHEFAEYQSKKLPEKYACTPVEVVRTMRSLAYGGRRYAAIAREVGTDGVFALPTGSRTL